MRNHPWGTDSRAWAARTTSGSCNEHQGSFPFISHQEIRKNLSSSAAPALTGCQCGREGTQNPSGRKSLQSISYSDLTPLHQVGNLKDEDTSSVFQHFPSTIHQGRALMAPGNAAESPELEQPLVPSPQQCHSCGSGNRPRGEIIITPSVPCIHETYSIAAAAF